MNSPIPAFKTILIAGVSGFIIRALSGYTVNGIDRFPAENAPLADLE